MAAEAGHIPDVIVFGAGAGGMTAALVCAIEGLSVLLCERSAQVGGTTATSAGTIWVPGTKHAKDAGSPDTIDDVRRYLDALIGPATDNRRDAYLETGREMLEYLGRKSEVKFSLYARHPDYQVNRPGATLAGRALAPLPFDGRLLGDDFKLLRPPIGEFMALGGMMIGRDDIEPLSRPFGSLASFRKALSLVWRQACDRLKYPRGTRLLMGNALAGRLLASLKAQHVSICVDTALQGLVIEDGRVTGADIYADGRPQRLTARRGIIIATGGFGGSVERMNDYVRPPLADAVAFKGADGDGIRIARAAGAAIEDDHASPVFWSPVSRTPWLEGGRGVYPHLSLDRSKPGLIAVNAAGRRFVDEALSYHDFVVGMHRSHETVPSIPTWLICDSAFLYKYGLGRIPPGRRRFGWAIKNNYLVEASSLEALAKAIGVDAAGLSDSVARNNRYATTGEDPDFGKGSTEFDRNNGDPRHTPNPCLGPIATAPYYAMAVYPSTLGSSVGLKCDANGRVLDANGAPIAGLFACGNDMASVMRGTYPGPGITIGPAMVFAYRAAMAIAGKIG
ncbi:FAD-dependent oxidoreductase [Rhodoplanes sp. Z2-YC6860]|uniref:FAD-dependent oxidoreductase n=1 Tax=Rhodoplanes sp. Z2-YC6860 TaxID=674703 RepID=UPI00078C1186|nr:FAD-dependent oxidoreductase [Rhodoplanes sp. Z2-YC6860]AMN43024.1 fumarate reductase/succinate dehydrogenase flavoprotein domain-containing protein [Rhodoplanes sp. Z2-YC6860]